MSKDFGQKLIVIAASVESRLSLPEGFLVGVLMEASDWALMIQLSALVETAMTDFLIRSVGQAALSDHIAKLNFSQKLRWAKSLDGVQPDHAKFVDALMAVRNRLAHQIRHVPTFNLSAYISSLLEGDRARLLMGAPPTAKVVLGPVTGDRFTLWINVLFVILTLEESDIERRQQAVRQLAGVLEAQQSIEQEVLQRLLTSASPIDGNTPDSGERR